MKLLYRRLVGSVAATSFALSPLSGRANPLGGQVTAGSATITGQGTGQVTVNQTTGRAIVEWRTFNLAPGETTRFQQPDSSSVTLNRVTGGTGPSQINGTVSANGGVYVINPDGILFGPSATINVGSFLGTTHDIRNDDFMAGRNNFTIPGNPTASIVNQGTITAAEGGFAALVAPGVRNDGVITARLGTVALASGNGFTLDLYGDSLIKLQPSDAVSAEVRDVATGRTLKSLVENTAVLRADGGRVALTAVASRRVLDSVINSSGVIEATTVGTRKGMVVFGAATADVKPADAPRQVVRVSGRIQAAGQQAGTQGGTVQITGEHIELSSLDVNATGMAGGGKILVGGDTGGGRIDHSALHPAAKFEDRQIPNATSVSVESTTLDASATKNGNGGKVIVWADGTTSFSGTVFARGGPEAGDGGFAEISGRNGLQYAGFRADLSSNTGRPGILLFDPNFMNVGPNEASSINITLNSGTSVNLSADRITISADISKTSGRDATLTLDAIQLRIADNVTIGSTSGALPIFIRLRPLSDADSQQTLINALTDLQTNGLDAIEIFNYFNVNGNYGSNRASPAQFFGAFGSRLSENTRNSFGYSVLTQPPIVIGNNARIYTNGGDIRLETYSYSLRATPGGSVGFGPSVGRTRDYSCSLKGGCGVYPGVSYDNGPNVGPDAIYGSEGGVAYVSSFANVVTRTDVQIRSGLSVYNGIAAFNSYIGSNSVLNSSSPVIANNSSPSSNLPITIGSQVMAGSAGSSMPALQTSDYSKSALFPNFSLFFGGDFGTDLLDRTTILRNSPPFETNSADAVDWSGSSSAGGRERLDDAAKDVATEQTLTLLEENKSARIRAAGSIAKLAKDFVDLSESIFYLGKGIGADLYTGSNGKFTQLNSLALLLNVASSMIDAANASVTVSQFLLDRTSGGTSKIGSIGATASEFLSFKKDEMHEKTRQEISTNFGPAE